MEDRLTHALYLEMSQQDPAAYEKDRVADVMALDGVARATWWSNAMHENELPRELPEFTTLGVYECDASFVAPIAPDSAGGYHYVRTSRPGQGRLTGKPTLSIMIAMIGSTTPEQTQPLRDWNDYFHLSTIAQAAVPGYTMITPYEHASQGDPQWLHFYEFDRPDAVATWQQMLPRVEQIVGPWGTPGCTEWANHEALRIFYINLFELVGERSR